MHTSSGCIVNQTGSGQHDANQDCGCGGHVNWQYSYGKDFNDVNGGMFTVPILSSSKTNLAQAFMLLS
jgi:hypothetical protein